jgi:hypothetical protein
VVCELECEVCEDVVDVLEVVLCDADELEELDGDELEEDDEDEGEGVCVGVGVGVGVGVFVGWGFSALLFDCDCEELPLSALPAGKTTTLAVEPFGTVTTQKLEPPAPDAWSLLVTPPTPLTVGSMEQGSPLQPPPLHSILTPKVGGVLLRSLFCQTGFQAIFMKESPFATVFAPAT